MTERQTDGQTIPIVERLLCKINALSCRYFIRSRDWEATPSSWLVTVASLAAPAWLNSESRKTHLQTFMAVISMSHEFVSSPTWPIWVWPMTSRTVVTWWWFPSILGYNSGKHTTALLRLLHIKYIYTYAVRLRVCCYIAVMRYYWYRFRCRVTTTREKRRQASC